MGERIYTVVVFMFLAVFGLVLATIAIKAAIGCATIGGACAGVTLAAVPVAIAAMSTVAAIRQV